MAFRRHGRRHYGAGSAWERHNDRGGQVATDDGLVETETTSLLAAANLTWSPGPWQLSGSLDVADQRFESERDGVEVLGDLAVGYDWQLSGVTLTPTPGLSAS